MDPIPAIKAQLAGPAVQDEHAAVAESMGVRHSKELVRLFALDDTDVEPQVAQGPLRQSLEIGRPILGDGHAGTVGVNDGERRVLAVRARREDRAGQRNADRSGDLGSPLGISHVYDVQSVLRDVDDRGPTAPW
jgi:hypothetical protein